MSSVSLTLSQTPTKSSAQHPKCAGNRVPVYAGISHSKNNSQISYT